MRVTEEIHANIASNRTIVGASKVSQKSRLNSNSSGVVRESEENVIGMKDKMHVSRAICPFKTVGRAIHRSKAVVNEKANQCG
jgi:hypothetical protein